MPDTRVRLSEPITRVGDSHHALDGNAQNFKTRVRNLGIGPAQSTDDHT
jgi:hypothetical protein